MVPARLPVPIPLKTLADEDAGILPYLLRATLGKATGATLQAPFGAFRAGKERGVCEFRVTQLSLHNPDAPQQITSARLHTLPLALLPALWNWFCKSSAKQSSGAGLPLSKHGCPSRALGCLLSGGGRDELRCPVQSHGFQSLPTEPPPASAASCFWIALFSEISLLLAKVSRTCTPQVVVMFLVG